ncbi:hypothetical protein MUDAN_MDHGFNIF_03581 [Lactiplantibacillus mudanjiangensis]|uniref:Uncharacterized protein n=2 Tax=Lactiplantibacillus mudanjiangensis TaxID=1296538 RepID=A0A660DWV5_9LACO|nr:hypothetical protein MUDAN_MDHGFNIF_03581 [Lactiplantibacillus mudanjiangensis]
MVWGGGNIFLWLKYLIFRGEKRWFLLIKKIFFKKIKRGGINQKTKWEDKKKTNIKIVL